MLGSEAAQRARAALAQVAMTARRDLRVLGSRQDGNFYSSARDAREVQLELPYAPGSFVTEGFSPARFGAVRGIVGYAPLAPGSLPSGYARAETRVARTTPGPTGNEGMNPPSSSTPAWSRTSTSSPTSSS